MMKRGMLAAMGAFLMGGEKHMEDPMSETGSLLSALSRKRGSTKIRHKQPLNKKQKQARKKTKAQKKARKIERHNRKH